MNPPRPDPSTPQTINVSQNSQHSLDLLAAADTAHADSQRWEITRAVLAVAVALGATTAAFIGDLAPLMSLVGLAGAIAQQALILLSAGHTTVATRMQESFDSGLFGLSRTADAGPAPTPEDIDRLARRYPGPPKHNWYVDVTDLPPPYAVLICQRENLQWDWPLRRRWARSLLVAATGWLVLGVVIALAADWTTRELVLRMWAPSAPAWLLAYTLAYRHRTLATRKQQLAIDVDEELAVLPAVTPTEPADPAQLAQLHGRCLSYQASMFHLRDHPERIPGRLYRTNKAEDEGRARAAAQRIRLRLLDRAG